MTKNLRGRIRDLKRLQSSIAKGIASRFKVGTEVKVVWDDGEISHGKVRRFLKWNVMEIETPKRLIPVDLGKCHVEIEGN